ncbi:MAG: RidA family protein [Acidobacteria bacterium]|nr:RidA family protein [Acidobacteriota bacterium]
MRSMRVCLVLAVVLTVEGLAMQPSGKQVVNVGPSRDLPFSSAVKAGGLVYVSGTLATDAKNQIVPGDMKAQTKQVLDNLAAALKAAGSSMDNVASVNVYIKNAADFAAMNEVYRTYWPKDPPVRTTITANLVRPEGLVEMSMIAIPNDRERQVIHPADWMKSPNPYSYGIKSGDTLFLAGLVSRNGRDNSVIEGDITKQTRTVLDNGGEILKAAGMTFADVAAARVYITDTALFQDMNAAYRPYFATGALPARATVRAGLMGAQYLVEITMTAVRGNHEPFTTPAADGTPGKPGPNFSSAIRVGNRLWVSGTLGSTESNKGDGGAQTRETLARIGRTLKVAGFDFANVVEGVVFLTDLKNYDPMNQAYRGSIAKDFPARATVQAGLVVPDGLVEIMLTAVK